MSFPCTRELDEPEALADPRCAVLDDLHFFDSAVRVEEPTELVLSDVGGQIADV